MIKSFSPDISIASGALTGLRRASDFMGAYDLHVAPTTGSMFIVELTQISGLKTTTFTL